MALALCYTSQEDVLFLDFSSCLPDVPRHYALEEVIDAKC
jgi:hypothetical protein